MNPREKLKRELMQKRGYCEGQAYFPHRCIGGLEMNELFYKRNDCKQSEQKKYIVDERNCCLICSWFHMTHGHTKGFTRWYAQVQAENYDDFREYLDEAPFKIKTTSRSLLD